MKIGTEGDPNHPEDPFSTASSKIPVILVVSLTLIIMLVSAAFCSVYLFREYTKVYKITHMGDMWSFVNMEDDSAFPPFVDIDPDDFPHPPYPERGDILVAIEGRPATRENYFLVFSTDTPPGEIIRIMYVHDGDTYTTEIVTRTIPGSLKLQIWGMFLLRSLIVIGLLFTGIWAFMRRSASSAVRTLTLFCFTLAVQMALSSTIVAHLYASFQISADVILFFGVLGLASSSFWLKLHLLFPVTNRRYAEHRIIANAVIFLPVLAAGYFTASNGAMPRALWLSMYHTVYLSAGFSLLINNYVRAESFIRKRQTRLVLLGSFLGIVFFILFGWFRYYLSVRNLQMAVQTNMLISNIVFILMIPIPLSILYAFRKYRLLEVEGKLRRGTRFLSVNLLLLTFFFGLLYLFGEFVLDAVGISSQTPTLVLGLILALAFTPSQRRLRRRIEDYFYPEKKRLRNLLKEFLASSMVHTEEESFWISLREKLADGLAAENIYPVLRIDEEGRFEMQNHEPVPFCAADQIVEALLKRDSSLLIDEAIESGRISLTEEQKQWFQARKCAVILPLTVSSGLVGFLAIGCKTNGEDFTAEELDLLSSFSAQIALVAENIQLLGEKIEKQKLQEQLTVARQIQRGLLPGRIPVLDWLEISARIRFCLDVAGDYYDVMKLDDGEVVIAVADVSGKGVGPALLMANLQASLRTTREMGITLAEAVAKINSLIYDNTPSEMFITFFIACLDPVEGTLRYVNAGHNAPVLLDREGNVRRLSNGGLLLGFRGDSTYEEDVLSVRTGDMLLTYTDGISEAMDASEEEYGEDRIIELMKTYSELSLEEMLDMLEKDVESFHGSGEFADDMTLLAVRITDIPESGP